MGTGCIITTLDLFSVGGDYDDTGRAGRTGIFCARILVTKTVGGIAPLPSHTAAATRIADASAVDTLLTRPTCSGNAGIKAVSITAKLVGLTLNLSAGISHAFGGNAALTRRARCVPTAGGYTFTEFTRLVRPTVEVAAGIRALARPGITYEAGRTQRSRTGIRVTDLLSRPRVDACRFARTLTPDTGKNTLTKETKVSPRTSRTFVHASITVVVDAIADFRRCHATRPALIEESLVGLSITVIVDVVTDLVLGPNSAVAGQRPALGVTRLRVRLALLINATLATNPALPDTPNIDGGTTEASEFVEDAITIIVFAVTRFFSGADAITGVPSTVDASL